MSHTIEERAAFMENVAIVGHFHIGLFHKDISHNKKYFHAIFFWDKKADNIDFNLVPKSTVGWFSFETDALYDV